MRPSSLCGGGVPALCCHASTGIPFRHQVLDCSHSKRAREPTDEIQVGNGPGELPSAMKPDRL